MRRVAGWVALLLCAGAAAGALATACARISALAEVIANLRYPIGLAALVGAALAGVTRRPRTGLVGLALGLVLAWPTLRLWLPRGTSALEAAMVSPAVEVRLASVNLLFGRVQPVDVEAFADAFEPDVLGLLELLQENRSSTDWFATLESWRERWPHQIVLPHGLTFGMALLSKHPLEDVRWLDPPGGANIYAQRPGLLRAVARIDGTPVRLFLAHPDRPGRAWRVRARASIFDAIVEEIGTDPTVVFGDLNCTEGSPLFSDLLERGGLRDSRRGFGPCFSWRHERVPGRWVTIDHVLVSPDVGVLERATGQSIGSDHLPVAAVLTIPR